MWLMKGFQQVYHHNQMKVTESRMMLLIISVEHYSYLITMTTNAHKKVVWFDVSVDEILCVYILNSADHLQTEHKDSTEDI